MRAGFRVRPAQYGDSPVFTGKLVEAAKASSYNGYNEHLERGSASC